MRYVKSRSARLKDILAQDARALADRGMSREDIAAWRKVEYQKRMLWYSEQDREAKEKRALRDRLRRGEAG